MRGARVIRSSSSPTQADGSVRGMAATPRRRRGRARETLRLLAEEYPGTAKELCALDHDGPFQLLCATILSAQTTDERVNLVTPTLFARYPTAAALAAADPADVEEIIKSTGFYRNKTKSLIGMAQALVERFDGEVPRRLEDLVTLPGVGRKTGNVIRSVAMGEPGSAGRHPRRPAVGPTRTDDADGSRQGRVRAQRAWSRRPSGARSAFG